MMLKTKRVEFLQKVRYSVEFEEKTFSFNRLSQETALALSALKTLGRHPTSSKILVKTEVHIYFLGVRQPVNGWF